MNDSQLRTSLLDLLRASGQVSRGILLGGGYGLYLKQLHLAQSGHRTLIEAEVWPAPRATQDLDLMPSTELVADPTSMGVIRAALDKLGYKVVKGAEYMQFARVISGRQVVKIDLRVSHRGDVDRGGAGSGPCESWAVRGQRAGAIMCGTGAI